MDLEDAHLHQADDGCKRIGDQVLADLGLFADPDAAEQAITTGLARAGGRRMGAALLAAALIAAVAGTTVYVAKRGSPLTDVAHAWNQFKTKGTPHGGTNRLGRLGSDRYDFWRVALKRFEHAPLAGIGADNYQEAYLLYGKSAEQPLYPHSVELRTLSQTGLVGAVRDQ